MERKEVYSQYWSQPKTLRDDLCEVINKIPMTTVRKLVADLHDNNEAGVGHRIINTLETLIEVKYGKL